MSDVDSKETDEEGSKVGEGDYEDVRNFDEDADLKLSVKAAAAPAAQGAGRPTAAPAGASGAAGAGGAAVVGPSSAAGAGVVTVAVPSPVRLLPGVISPIVMDQITSLENLARIVQLSWVVSAGKRPPRDMKRLDQSTWYVVCKATRWGECTALFLRGLENNEDAGFFKPPLRYSNFEYDVGDCLRVSRVGYSASRNKIAMDIAIRPTPFKDPTPEKLAWMPNDSAVPLSVGAISGSGIGSDEIKPKRHIKRKPTSEGGSSAAAKKRQATAHHPSSANEAMLSSNITPVASWNHMPPHPLMHANGSFPNLLFPFPGGNLVGGSMVINQAFDSFYNPSGRSAGVPPPGQPGGPQPGGPYLSSPTQSSSLIFPSATAQSPQLGAAITVNRRPSDSLSGVFSGSFFGIGALGGLSRGESFGPTGFAMPSTNDSPSIKYSELKPN